ncbi:hypothetical protein C8R41DRAFT_926713 [Lentinula lateritia]|uniref:eIF3a PCI domain-containing protein n=1 Tax=Lentinula lateritia TaxID=40482 RepID=A0ABQ8UXQ0_9AGAR|nr:hypothetical protein C8R41DRAFT_926713 [Lentinula lateritia]
MLPSSRFQKRFRRSVFDEAFSTKRFRSTPVTALEPILIRFMELCVELRKGRTAKEGLRQYKNLAQNTNVGSIEVVVGRFIEMAEGKVVEAKEKAREVAAKEVELGGGAAGDVDDLEAPSTPESILLSSISSPSSASSIHSDSTSHIVHPLNTVAGAAATTTPSLVGATAAGAGGAVTANTASGVGSGAGSAPASSSLTIKSTTTANYYEKLSRVFLMSGHALYPAAAWAKYYNLVTYAGAKAVGTGESKEVLAGSPSHHCLSALLNLPSPTSGSATSSSSTSTSSTQNPAPSRSALLSSALSRNVLNPPPTVPKLYHALEVDFNPSTLCESVAPLLEELGGASTSGASGASGMNGEDSAAIDDGYKPVQPRFGSTFSRRTHQISSGVVASLPQNFAPPLKSSCASPSTSTRAPRPSAGTKFDDAGGGATKSCLPTVPRFSLTGLLEGAMGGILKGILKGMGKEGREAVEKLTTSTDLIDTTSLIKTQVLALERDKSLRLSRLKTISKRFDHLDRVSEMPLLKEDYSVQQGRDRVEWDVRGKEMKEEERKIWEEEMATKARLARTRDDWEDRKSTLLKRKGEEFALHREEAQRKIEPEKSKRLAEVLKHQAEV